MKLLLSLLLLLGGTQSGTGMKANPAGARLVSAKTACIKLANGSQEDLATARRELKKWGRFKVVESCPQADVAVWLASRNLPAADICGATLQVLGAQDNAVLWTGSMRCKTKTSPLVIRLIRQLKTDISHTKK
jgi:hypothetical protein